VGIPYPHDRVITDARSQPRRYGARRCNAACRQPYGPKDARKARWIALLFVAHPIIAIDVSGFFIVPPDENYTSGTVAINLASICSLSIGVNPLTNLTGH
jgi:hypothetical protein